MESKSFKIDGMTCAACANRVERFTKKVDGVESATVNFATETLTVEYDKEKVNSDIIEQTVDKAGYKVRKNIQSYNLKVEGMTCAACSSRVERVTRKLPGVIESTVNLATERLVITINADEVTYGQIKAAVEKSGYKLVKEEEKKEDADAASDVVDKDGNSVTEDADAKDDSEEEKDERKVIYYVTDKVQQGQYIKLFKEQGMDAVILDHNIDTSFISQLEQRNEHYKFMRIDADVTDSLKDADDAADLKEETDTLTDLFKKALGNDKLTVKVEKLKNENLASIITLSEEGRRMQDMMKMYAMGGMGGMDPNMFAADQTLTLNANHALVKYIFEHKDSENVPMFCEQLYDLAMLSNQPLSVDAMSKFVERSNKIMMLLAK